MSDELTLRQLDELCSGIKRELATIRITPMWLDEQVTILSQRGLDLLDDFQRAIDRAVIHAANRLDAERRPSQRIEEVRVTRVE